MKNISKRKHLIIDGICMIILILIDQFTKKLAVLNLKDKPPFVIIDKVFVLSYLENRGAAFGMMQNRQIFFLIVSLLFLVAICYVLFKLPLQKKYLAAEIVFVALAAGAVGNMIDRAVNNYVVDFFYFELIDFPVFNVADIYVTLSSIALFILLIFIYKEEDLEFIKFFKTPDKKDEQL